jgi:YHS domain-containing protein
MKKGVCVLCVALALAAVGILAGCDQKGAKEEGPAAPTAQAQTTCPVMGGKIDKTIFADYEGKRVYFCCPDCVKTFNKEPQKYVKKLEDEGVTLAKTPAKGG